MINRYLHIVVIIVLSQIAVAQQATIDIWASPAADLDALPNHAFDHGELDFMSYFAGCPLSIPPFPLSTDCGATTVYYVWGKFVDVPVNARIRALHIVASPLGGAVIEDSVIYRHSFNDGTHVWDRWDNTGPIVMHGDPNQVGRAATSAGSGIRNSNVANPYDLYCYGTRTFLIGAVRLRCPNPCAGSWLRLGIGSYGFQVFSQTSQDISAQIKFRLCNEPTPISNPPPSGLPYWYQATRCGGIFFDCNHNGIPDECDISCSREGCESYPGCGHSVDCDQNGVPDECQSGLGPPVILEQPTSQTRCIGHAATFTVVAAGNPAPTYKWFKNGHVIPGATEAAYTIPWVDPLDAGAYAVWVVGICDITISETVTLTVFDAPAVAAPPADQTVAAGDTATFTVGASGAGTSTYQWRRAAIALSDGPFVTGAQTATLTIERADAVDAGWYDVVITNECGYVVSPHALLTVHPGPCPPRGAPYVTKTYVLTGDANNTPWSWRIESTDGKFTDAVELHVTGVAEGGALAVAEHFADSVNAYAAAHGRGAGQIYAIGKEAFGQTLLAIRTGGNAGFRLWVGPADQPPTCLVVPEQLPACGFNPTIVAVPDEPVPPHAAASESPPQAVVSAAAPETSGGLVHYDLRTGQATRHPSSALRADPIPGGVDLSRDAARSFDPRAALLRDRGLTLTPVTNLSLPASAVCKIFYTQLGVDQEATGCFIDPKHVLTSGMVVNSGGDWQWGRGWVAGEWSTRVEVVPCYWDGGGPWGSYSAVNLRAFDDWISRGDTQDMFGVIVLDSPVGARTGWCEIDYVFNNFSGMTLVGYPNESPYADGRLYEQWALDVQFGGWDRFDYGSYYGLRGAPLRWNWDDAVVRSVHAWDDNQSPTRVVPIRQHHMYDLYDLMYTARNDGADFIPCALAVDRSTVEAGESLNVDFLIVNYGNAGGCDDHNQRWLVRLSYDNDTDESDLVLASDFLGGTWLSSLEAVAESAYMLLPADLYAGTYWLGVELQTDDADPNNNATHGDAMVELTVTCGEIGDPNRPHASDGLRSDGIRVEWDAVVGRHVRYDVYKDDDPDPPHSLCAADQTFNGYLDNDPNLIAGQTYYYWVLAHNECGHSAWSDYDTGWKAIIAAPEVTTSLGTDTSAVHITWDPLPGPGSYYYALYRNTTNDPNSAARINEWSAQTYWEDPQPPIGQVRFYWVKASTTDDGMGNESGFSASNIGWKGVPPPASVTASDGDGEYYSARVHVHWALIPGISKYQVLRAELNDPNTLHTISQWQDASSSFDAYYDDTHAVPGVDYKYYVRGSFYANGSYAGSLSAPDTGWRLLNPPANVTATDGEYTDVVVVTWNAPPGGVYFDVWRGTSADPNYAAPVSANPAGWGPETGFADTTAVPGVHYYYWVIACGGRWCAHMTGFSTPDIGWRAVDCNGNGIPDQIDPNAIAPAIVQPPLDLDVCLGEPTTFTVTAMSTMAVSYQWRRNTSPIPDANAPTVTIPWTDPGDAGSYDVVVTNGCGSITSMAATLSVLMPVTITQFPQTRIVDIGEGVTFDVAATGEGPLAYQWRHGTVPLTDGGNITGATTATLTITNVQAEDAGAYDVVVSNVCGAKISLPGALGVGLPPLPGFGYSFTVNTYQILGTGARASWSWRIESANGAFENTPSIDVSGEFGSALELAQGCAAGINDYALAHGCPVRCLDAQAAEVAGTVTLSVRSPVDAPLVLFVGPAGGPADCRVELPAAACAVGALLIEQLPLPGRDCNRNRQDDLVDLISGLSTDADHNGIPDDCAVGDMNCDGAATYADINPFVLALGGQAYYEARYPECRWMNADINGDGVVSFADINPFVALLAGR